MAPASAEATAAWARRRANAAGGRAKNPALLALLRSLLCAWVGAGEVVLCRSEKRNSEKNHCKLSYGRTGRGHGRRIGCNGC